MFRARFFAARRKAKFVRYSRIKSTHPDIKKERAKTLAPTVFFRAPDGFGRQSVIFGGTQNGSFFVVHVALFRLRAGRISKWVISLVSKGSPGDG